MQQSFNEDRKVEEKVFTSLSPMPVDIISEMFLQYQAIIKLHSINHLIFLLNKHPLLKWAAELIRMVNPRWFILNH